MGKINLSIKHSQSEEHSTTNGKRRAIPVSRICGSTATTQSWYSSHAFLAMSSLRICGAQKTGCWKAT